MLSREKRSLNVFSVGFYSWQFYYVITKLHNKTSFCVNNWERTSCIFIAKCVKCPRNMVERDHYISEEDWKREFRRERALEDSFLRIGKNETTINKHLLQSHP